MDALLKQIAELLTAYEEKTNNTLTIGCFIDSGNTIYEYDGEGFANKGFSFDELLKRHSDQSHEEE